MLDSNIIISFSNILLTLGLVVFSCLQWSTVVKQNKQNLFTLRIDSYDKINKIVWDILFDLMNIKDNIDKEQSVSNISLHCLELSHYLLKTRYLFNSDLEIILDEFIKECVKSTSSINKNIDVENLDFYNVFKKSDKLKDVFEKFFDKNKL